MQRFCGKIVREGGKLETLATVLPSLGGIVQWCLVAKKQQQPGVFTLIRGHYRVPSSDALYSCASLLCLLSLLISQVSLPFLLFLTEFSRGLITFLERSRWCLLSACNMECCYRADTQGCCTGPEVWILAREWMFGLIRCSQGGGLPAHRTWQVIPKALQPSRHPKSWHSCAQYFTRNWPPLLSLSLTQPRDPEESSSISEIPPCLAVQPREMTTL